MLLQRPPPPEDPDPLHTKEVLHWGVLLSEYTAVWALGVLRCARNLASIEVTPVGGEAPSGRYTVPELLAEHERLLVLGGEGAGKTTLVAHLALHARVRGRAAAAAALVPFVLPVALTKPGERLTVETLARLSPAAGAALIERTLADRRAVIIVDGVDRAPGGPSALLESIPVFARAHAGNHFVVTTRPLSTGLPGHRRTTLPDFLTTAILPPLPPSRVLPAYRFVGLRSPERKAALCLERVDALLHAWDGAALPPGSVLGSLTPRDVRKLVAMIATDMHKRCDYEIELGTLTEEIAGALWRSVDGARLRVELPRDGIVPRPHKLRPAPELAPAVVREIRAHPGLLVERRPGRFVFADFVLQEVLTAARLAGREGIAYLVEERHDPWWHGVIELAAGLPQVDSARLVSELLDADWGDAAVVSVLAARCAEAAPNLPERTRRTVARRFSAYFAHRERSFRAIVSARSAPS